MNYLNPKNKCGFLFKYTIKEWDVRDGDTHRDTYISVFAENLSDASMLAGKIGSDEWEWMKQMSHSSVVGFEYIGDVSAVE